MGTITIAAIGSRGDVQPFVALGSGLRRAGYDVRIVAGDEYESLVRGYGLDFWSLGMHMMDTFAGGVDRALESGRNAMQAINEIVGILWPLLDTMQESTWQASQGADALIASVFAIPGGHLIAEKLGIPFVPAPLYPLLQPTRALPNWLLIPFPVNLGGALNALTHRVVHQVWWQSTRTWSNEWRQHLGLPAHRVTDYPFATVNGKPVHYLYGFSPTVIPRPPDWGPHAHVTGCWFLPPPEDWEPSSELASFIAAGPPPVYLGFGSVGFYRARETVQVWLEALERAGQRGVIAVPPEALADLALPESVYALASCPHEWLFPRMAAVVHHGGAGTTAAGLRSGVPSIVVPFAADQPHWADCVQALGAGPQPIPRQRLTAERLAYAIRIAVTHGPLRQRAADVGAAIRAEDGVGAAVQVINGVLAS